MAAHRALITGAPIALGVALAIGCQVPQRVPPIYAESFEGGPSRRVFDALLAAAETSGYDVLAEDAHRGSFRVLAHAPLGQTAHVFVVQCYASGHVEIVPVGPRVHREGSDYVMPALLRRELVALAQALSIE